MKAGLARMQMSIHAKVVKLSLVSRATFHPGFLEKRHLLCGSEFEQETRCPPYPLFELAS